MERFLEAGRIVGTHGIKGELRVDPLVDSPEFFKKIQKLYFDKGLRDAGRISARIHKNLVLVCLEGIEDPTAADAIRGKLLYMDRQEIKLPKNRYFITDLVGLQVYDGKTGQYYGTVEDVFKTGANNVYRIVNGEYEYLFPAVDHMIAKTDLEAGRLEVLPISGIFDTQGYEA